MNSKEHLKALIRYDADANRYSIVGHNLTAEEAETISINKGAGCPTCSGSGYKGRVCLYEVMDMTDDLRDAVILGSTAIELKKRALQGGMISLRRSGLLKVKDGITTIEEVLRETIK